MKKNFRISVVCLSVTTTAFCGMFAPIVFGSASRNAIWEPIFGAGFLISEFTFRPFVGNPVAGLIGCVIWPLLVAAGIALAVWKITAAPRRGALVAAGLFSASLLFWISAGTASWLSLHYVPFFTYYAAVWY